MSDDGTYVLFGIEFENKRLWDDALIEISAFSEKLVFNNEKEIIEHLLKIDIDEIHNFANLIIKTIKLRTTIKIKLDNIINSIYDYIYIKEISYFKDDTYATNSQYEMIYSESEEEREKRTERYTTNVQVGDSIISFKSKSIMHNDIENIMRDRCSILLGKLDYRTRGTDSSLSLEEKRKGILHTMSILDSEIKTNLRINNGEHKVITRIQEKMNNSRNRRNQKLERLISLMKTTKTNYILEDENGLFFYPFLANIVFAHYVTYSILENNKETIQALKELDYKINRTGKKTTDIICIKDDEMKKSLLFYDKFKINQIWGYLAAVYTRKYNIKFSEMRKLIKFFISDNPRGNTNTLKEEKTELPTPLTELNKFSKNI